MDRYKRSISRKNKIYRPYTIDGIGNFYFSPGTVYSLNAWLVTSSGVVYYYEVGYNVIDSYGHLFDKLFQNSIFLWLRSPITNGFVAAYLVNPSGFVYFGFNNDANNSYGRKPPYTDFYGDYCAWHVRSSGDVGSHYRVGISYGRERSPNTYYSDDASRVNHSGVVNLNDHVNHYSYGK